MASNLWEFYSGKGQSLPSLSTRSQTFQQYGLGDAGSYQGTAAQNNALLAALQGGGAPAASAPTAGGGGGNASPSADYGAYGDIINTLSGQEGELDSIYNPQITTLQNYMPTIQKKYSDMLAELTRQTEVQTGKLAAGKVTDVGNMAVQQAGAGVAESFGTPEMAAQQAVKTKYDQAQQSLLADADAQRKGYGTQQSQEELAVQQQIAALVAQKATSAQSIKEKIAQAKAQALDAAEKTRQFNESLALDRQKAANSGKSSSDDDNAKKIEAFNKDLKSGLGMDIAIHGEEKGSSNPVAQLSGANKNYITRESLIKKLATAHPEIDQADIATAVYNYYAG